MTARRVTCTIMGRCTPVYAAKLATIMRRREAELLGHLVAGADTREVARQMFVSGNTVQDHLKSVFTKTATRSRRALLARALGT